MKSNIWITLILAEVVFFQNIEAKIFRPFGDQELSDSAFYSLPFKDFNTNSENQYFFSDELAMLEDEDYSPHMSTLDLGGGEFEEEEDMDTPIGDGYWLLMAFSASYIFYVFKKKKLSLKNLFNSRNNA